MEFILPYISIATASMLKFVGGPLLGLVYHNQIGMTWWEIGLSTAVGAMTTIMLLATVLGKPLKLLMVRFMTKKHKVFSPKSRRMVRTWRRFGLPGTAFLTPVLLTPIGGAIVASSFGEPPLRIFVAMGISCLFWGFLQAYAVVALGNQIQQWF
jgi:hypothetical protein